MTTPVLTYDAEAKAIYIRLSDAEIFETLELSASTFLDVDDNGAPIGFEILQADPLLLADISAHPEGTPLRNLLKASGA